MKKKVLVVVAHPDDEVLGCGGTIRRLSDEDTLVSVVILGEGVTSRFKRRDEADSRELEQLREKCEKACELLGVADVTFKGLPDNRFDTVPLLDIVKQVEAIIEKMRPAIIFTHHHGDLNIDHCITQRAVITATRPAEGNSVQAIYSFEVPSSTEWAFGSSGEAFVPTCFSDISRTIDAKIKAMSVYETELRAFPHPRSERALRAIAERWGCVSGMHAAEAFHVVRCHL